jgi:hypothetical protein
LNLESPEHRDHNVGEAAEASRMGFTMASIFAATSSAGIQFGAWYHSDPGKNIYRGCDEIDCIAGTNRATHPDVSYQLIAEPEEAGNGGRVKWVSGRPGETPAYAGTDFIVARDGRIAALYLPFD